MKSIKQKPEPYRVRNKEESKNRLINPNQTALPIKSHPTPMQNSNCTHFRHFALPKLLLVLVLLIPSMADSSSSEPKVHIVYTEQPQGLEPEAHHLKTLTSVLGSEEAAKEALGYVYKNAATGFSAKLTPEQVEKLSKQPGVLQVTPSKTYYLHSGPGNLQI